MSRSRLDLEAERLGSHLGLGQEALVSIPAIGLLSSIIDRKILIFFSCGLHAEMFQIAKAPVACVCITIFSGLHTAQSAAVLGWLPWVMNSGPVVRPL
jgi:hypothetical protein